VTAPTTRVATAAATTTTVGDEDGELVDSDGD
jgi:hypothetical protein